MRLGKSGENTRSRTHCPNGHPYDEVNTYKQPNGYRGCKACRRAANKRYVKKGSYY